MPTPHTFKVSKHPQKKTHLEEGAEDEPRGGGTRGRSQTFYAVFSRCAECKIPMFSQILVSQLSHSSPEIHLI